MNVAHSKLLIISWNSGHCFSSDRVHYFVTDSGLPDVLFRGVSELGELVGIGNLHVRAGLVGLRFSSLFLLFSRKPRPSRRPCCFSDSHLAIASILKIQNEDRVNSSYQYANRYTLTPFHSSPAWCRPRRPKAAARKPRRESYHSFIMIFSRFRH